MVRLEGSCVSTEMKEGKSIEINQTDLYASIVQINSSISLDCVGINVTNVLTRFFACELLH